MKQNWILYLFMGLLMACASDNNPVLPEDEQEPTDTQPPNDEQTADLVLSKVYRDISIFTSISEFNINTNKEWETIDFGNKISKVKLIYNEDKLIRQDFYSPDGSFQGIFHQYYYNSEGKLIQDIQNPDNSPIITNINYDEDKVIFNRMGTNNTASLTFENGKITLVKSVENGDFRKNELIYDNNGNLIQVVNYKSEDEVLYTLEFENTNIPNPSFEWFKKNEIALISNHIFDFGISSDYSLSMSTIPLESRIISDDFNETRTFEIQTNNKGLPVSIITYIDGTIDTTTSFEYVEQ